MAHEIARRAGGGTANSMRGAAEFSGNMSGPSFRFARWRLPAAVEGVRREVQDRCAYRGGQVLGLAHIVNRAPFRERSCTLAIFPGR